MKLSQAMTLKPTALAIKQWIKPMPSYFKIDAKSFCIATIIGMLGLGTHQAFAESFPSQGDTKNYNPPGPRTIDANEGDARLVINGDITIMNINNIVLEILNFDSASRGGSISVSGGAQLNINTSGDGEVRFSNNRSDGFGGAIYNSNNSTFTIGNNASFRNNSVGISGGAITNLISTFTIGNNASFSGNLADTGGAILNTSGTFTIGDNASFSGNSAEFWGGAIRMVGSTFTIGDNASFSNNTADNSGGAIFNEGGGTLNFNVSDSTTILFTGNIDSTGANSIAFDVGDSTLNINTKMFNDSTTALFDMRDPMRASDEFSVPGVITIDKKDEGVWALGGNNNFTLAAQTNFNINSGTLYLYAQDEVANANPNDSGAMVARGGILMANAGSSFELAGGATVAAGGDNTINTGSGSIIVGDGATLRGGSASKSLGGNSPRNEAGGDTSLTFISATDTQLNGQLNLAALDVVDHFTLNAILVDGMTPGSVNKIGDGTVFLTGVNTYTGSSNIQSGKLMLGTSGSIAQSESVIVRDNATLDTSNNADTSINNLNGETGASVIIGSGNLDLNIGMNSTYSGAFVGDGTLNKNGNATLVASGDSPNFMGDLFVNAGVLEVNGNLGNANMTTIANNAVLQGVGTVGNLTVNGTIAPGNSIGTLNVAGNYVQNAGSTYQVEINPNGASDLIDITGTATINGGRVSVMEEPGTYTPQRYTILTAAGGRTGTYDDLIQTMPFLNFELAYDANNVFLDIVRSAVDFATLAKTRNEVATANAVQSLGLGNPVFNAVLNLANANQARQAFNALSGEAHASVLSAFTEDSRYVRQATLNRLDGALTTSAMDPTLVGLYAKGSSKFSETRHRGFWAHAYGAWGDMDGNSNAAKLSRNNKGFIIGADKRFGDAVAGILGGYSNSHMDVDARASSARSDDYTIGLYAGRMMNQFGAKLGGAYTWHQLDMNRTVSFPGFFNNLKTDYTGHTAQVFAEVDYDVSLSAMMLKPFAGAAYVYSDTGSFQERGGAAALRGDNDFDVFYTSLGVKQAMNLSQTANKVISESVTLAWRHAYGDTAPVSRFQFLAGGTPFGIQGVPIAKDSLLVDAGFDVDITPKNLSLRLAYSGQFADRVQDNGVTGTVSWKFD